MSQNSDKSSKKPTSQSESQAPSRIRYVPRANTAPSAPAAEGGTKKADTTNIHEGILNIVCDYYLNVQHNFIKNAEKEVPELEVRFRKKHKKAINRIEYNRIIQTLKSAGFVPESEGGVHMMRIYSEYTAPDGNTRMSSTRAEIIGLDMIQEYMNHNSIEKLINMPSNTATSPKVSFTKKIPANMMETFSKHGATIDVVDQNFRVSYQSEQKFHAKSVLARDIISKWTDSKKTFRLINRIKFKHPDYPFFVDLSVIRNSKLDGKGNMVPEYTIQESGVLNDVEHYEVEIEFDNAKAHGMWFAFEKASAAEIRTKIREMFINKLYFAVRLIIGSIQDSNYPIGNDEQSTVLREYTHLLFGAGGNHRAAFIGPSSYTLQIHNVAEQSEENQTPNIREGYSVTDKADGERRMMYIGNNGRIYMIDMAMNITYTGAITKEKTIYNTLIDGEYIKYNKQGAFINLYAAFDLYYIAGKSVRELEFMKNEDSPQDAKETKYRLLILRKLINEMIQPVSEVGNKTVCHLRIKCKDFEIASSTRSIFDCCMKILIREEDELFEYNTDGIIFTPLRFGVGGNAVGSAGPLSKATWDYSFKWKPAEYNTVDFLVRVKKNKKTQKDDIITEFNEMTNTKQYKTLILHCGYDETKHGYLNPMQDMLDGRFNNPRSLEEQKDNYKPVPFQPSNPADKNACYCKIELTSNGNMLTEEMQSFKENNIVEFRYDLTQKKWIPLRVRYDKTAELLSGKANYGNAYHVADNNWNSIHNPITSEMLKTGEGFVPINILDDENVYYANVSEETSTQSLRDFHNSIKYLLLTGMSKRGDTLIDYAVGKAGDLGKWIQSNLKFVFGIDVHDNNITYRLDGACARYLNMRKKNNKIPEAVFLTGNSMNNIRNGQAFLSDKNRMLTKALFGEGSRDKRVLGDVVYRNYGVGAEGFQISSCQFAIHYFFKNATTLHGFLRNVAECTCLGGYFIGTCYDGKTVFDKLQDRSIDDGWSIYKGTRQIFGIRKKYSETGFPDDEMGLGYPIQVFQESIGKEFEEYLVNFEYLVRLMDNYGFVILPKDEARQHGLPDGTAMFEQLFQGIQKEVETNPQSKRHYRTSLNMSNAEKSISFLNRYFIFKKVRTVNTAKIYKLMAGDEAEEKMPEEDETGIQKVVKDIKSESSKSASIRKIDHPKLNINEMDEDSSDESDSEEEEGEDFPTKEGIKVAVIIPYRDLNPQQKRGQHLAKITKELPKLFDKYIEEHKDRKLDYEIIVVEQSDDGKAFNRGKLLNIGYEIAIKEYHANVFIFHDVDLIPSYDLIDSYFKIPENGRPLHIAKLWDRYSSNPKYLGGIVSFDESTFSKINGFPNNFWGWGGEDDELYNRVNELGYTPVAPKHGSITDLEEMGIQEKMEYLRENRDEKNMVKWELLKEHKATWKKNGLNSLVFDVLSEKSIEKNTHKITVNVTKEDKVHEDHNVVVSTFGEKTGSRSKLDGMIHKIFKFMSSKEKEEIRDMVIEAKKTPSKMNRILTNISSMVKKAMILKKVTKDEGRQTFIASKLADYMKKELKVNFSDSTTIVDIGGGNGDVLHELNVVLGKERVNIPKENLICVETKTDWGEEYPFSNKDISYVFWNNNSIKVDTGSADVILCMVSLHHMKDKTLVNTLNEIHRILKPNGVLLIKEHDANTESRPYIEWEHHLYHIVDAGYEHKLINPDEYLHHNIDNYKPKEEWQKMITDEGFRFVDRKDRLLNGRFVANEDNASNMYWDAYVKI